MFQHKKYQIHCPEQWQKREQELTKVRILCVHEILSWTWSEKRGFAIYVDDEKIRTTPFSWLNIRFAWLDFRKRLFEPETFISFNQQLTEHEHHGMAVRHKNVDKSKVRYEG